MTIQKLTIKRRFGGDRDINCMYDATQRHLMTMSACMHACHACMKMNM